MSGNETPEEPKENLNPLTNMSAQLTNVLAGDDATNEGPQNDTNNANEEGGDLVQKTSDMVSNLITVDDDIKMNDEETSQPQPNTSFKEAGNDENQAQNMDNGETFATQPEQISDLHIHTNGSSQNRTGVSTPQLSPRQQFRQMIFGDKQKRRCTTSLMPRRRPPAEKTLTQQSIEQIADALMAGKPLKIEDPYAVAEIIDELNGRKLNAMTSNDYKTCRKITDTIQNARMQFRMHDRDILHQEIVSKLESRNKDSLDAIDQAKITWKGKIQDLHQKQQEKLKELQYKHQDQHQQLEYQWQDPVATRKFDKRSPQLLHQRQQEQYMLLCGNFEGADAMKKINGHLEKFESQEKHNEMINAFEYARAQLLYQQSQEVEKVMREQDYEMKLLLELEKEDLEKKNIRLQATQTTLDNEKDFDKFSAKHYKRPASCVVPASVTMIDSYDIPPLPKGLTIPKGGETMMQIRSKNIVTPLPLPPLKMKKYKAPKIIKPK